MAVTITYQLPSAVAGGTVAPTAAQAFYANTVGCQLSMADTDTTATITHSWGLTTTQSAQLQPFVITYLQTPGTAVPILSFSLAANTVVVTKATGAGSGGTYVVILQRPFSENL